MVICAQNCIICVAYVDCVSKESSDFTLPTTSDLFHLVTKPNIIIIDKTRYIAKLDQKAEYQYMFLRPPRWGKSTFLQTLARYYDKSSKDMFDDTFGWQYIGKHPTPYRSSLLVLVFDFSSISVLGTHDRTMADFDRVITTSLCRFLATNAKFLGDPSVENLMHGNGTECLERVLVGSSAFGDPCLTDEPFRPSSNRRAKNFSLGSMNMMRLRIHALFPSVILIPDRSSIAWRLC